VQVRVAAATLQAGMEIPEGERDGYWTNLNFLNSLRELGNTVSLLQSDIPDYLTGLRRREQLGTDPRWPRTPLELTSRRRSDEIPKAIEQLQLSYGKPGCVDICLASNIIEVGVDIDRLGLMTIVGQPLEVNEVTFRVWSDSQTEPWPGLANMQVRGFVSGNDVPPDVPGHRWDTVGGTLSVSPVLVEKYLVAAETVARATLFGPAPMKPERTAHQPWFSADAFSKNQQVLFDYDETGPYAAEIGESECAT